MRHLLYLLALASPLLASARPTDTAPTLDEIRIEIDDLKYALRTTQVDMNIIDEKLRKQEISKTQLLTISSLENKIERLEKTLDKITADLRALNTSTHQALTKIQSLEQQSVAHTKQLDNVAQLKTTLTTISKAIGQSPAPSTTASYKVKAGDSLEKIAKLHQVSVESIKKINKLTGDRIVIGQELKLRDDPT